MIRASRIVGDKAPIARALAQIDDVTRIGLVINLLGDPDLRSLVERELLRLLPLLRSTDAYVLKANHRERLYGALPVASPALARAILGALEQVGDPTAIPCVERVAAGEGVGAIDPTVRAAAGECLPVLYARRELEEWLAEREQPAVAVAGSAGAEIDPTAVFAAEGKRNEARPGLVPTGDGTDVDARYGTGTTPDSDARYGTGTTPDAAALSEGERA